jgi:NAD(P)-dependent dehydrogenase (short-subunit alcohol dehydrogenase family)
VEAISEALAQEVASLGIHVLIVEPSGFATQWAGASASFVPEDRRIDDYAETVHVRFPAYSAGAGNEAGEPSRAAQAIMTALGAERPPLRLPVGGYAVDGTLEKLEQVRADVLAWEQVARRADFPERGGVRTPGAGDGSDD